VYETRFERYIAPARVRPQLWRFGAGVLLATFVAFLTLQIVLGVLPPDQVNHFTDTKTPEGALFLLYSFFALILGVWVALWIFQKRGLRSVLGLETTPCFTVGASVAFALFAVDVFLMPGQVSLTPNLAPGFWVRLLPLIVVGVLIQTFAEELIFRGYFVQCLAARFRSPWIWALLPSAAFGLGHYDPGLMGDMAWLYALSTAFFGLVAVDLTARTGNLGAAWGLHFTNNFIAFGVVAAEGDLSGLGLFTTPFNPADAALTEALLWRNLIYILACWAVLRLALSRMRLTG